MVRFETFSVIFDSKEGTLRQDKGLTKKQAKLVKSDILSRKQMVKNFRIKNVRIVKDSVTNPFGSRWGRS